MAATFFKACIIVKSFFSRKFTNKNEIPQIPFVPSLKTESGLLSLIDKFNCLDKDATSRKGDGGKVTEFQNCLIFNK